MQPVSASSTPIPAVAPAVPASRLARLVKQFSKFVIVGGINTGIDIVVLRILVQITGIVSGAGIIVLNAISFSVAVVNSYFMNKRWTFREAAAGVEDKSNTIQFSQFFVVSIIGISINSGIVYFITTFVQPLLGISPQNWVIIAKLFATAASLVWNFLGYKFVVFKK